VESRSQIPWTVWLAALCASVLAGLLLVLTNGNLVVVLLPFLAIAGIYGLARAPAETTTLGFLFIAMLADDPRGAPHMGLWRSPLFDLGRVFFDALDKFGLPGMKLFGVEVALLLLVGLFVLRRYWSGREGAEPDANIVRAAKVAMATLLLLEVWGIARGGAMRFSVLQLRPLFFTFGVALFVAYTFAGKTRPIRGLLAVIIVVGILRAAVGAYFWRFILPGMAGSVDLSMGGGNFVTCHADSVLWAVGALICGVALFEKPCKATLALNVTALPIIMFAMVINNRRLAFVELFLAAPMIYLAAGRSLKNRVNRLVALSIPVLLAYVVAGWNAQGMWARPVQTLKSVLEREDSSSQMRDIENYNLLVTAKQNPLIGTGLGHEYIEAVRAISITDFMEAYRYVPHNSLLWLISAGGWLGFTFIWLFFGVGIFVAVRAYRHATRLVDRVGILVTIGVFPVYAVQTFGDMGSQSWMSVLMVGAMFGWLAARAPMLFSTATAPATTASPPSA
jgi:hypothetical protein